MKAVKSNDETGIKPEWLSQAEIVGVTAGVSAPEEIVLRVVDHLKLSQAVRVEELALEDENINCAIPQ